jgi:iron complex outermembrane receptor protein
LVGNEHKVNFGYHFDHYYLSSKKYNTTNWQNGSYNSLNTFQSGDTETQAVYAQDAWNLNKDYKLTYGLRLEGWKAYNGSLLTSTSAINYRIKNVNAASPKLSLERYFDYDISLRGSYGRATRFPTVAELFNGSNASNAVTINNPNLNPEVANSYEIALEKAFESGNARVSFFAEDMSNSIVSQTYTTNNGTTVTSFVNVNRTLTNGVETFGEVNNVFIDGLAFNGSVTYTQSKIKSFALMPSYDGNTNPGIPLWRGTAGALYTYGGFDAALTGNYSSGYFGMLSNADTNHNVYGGNSSFLFVNTKLSYKFQNGFGVSAGVDNLNNCKAFNYHPLQQRTYFVKAKYEF